MLDRRSWSVGRSLSVIGGMAALIAAIVLFVTAAVLPVLAHLRR